MELHNNPKNISLKIKDFFKKSNLLHNSFEIGILIKGIDGILEVIGGFLLIFFNPNRLNNIIVLLTQHELSEDRNDVIANFLLKTSHEFSVSSQHFGILYLFFHGIVKLIIVIMLKQRKNWAYPISVFFLISFIGYQIYRYTYTLSIWLIILTIFDIIMILLTLIEYSRINKQHK
jgi:uncharacterized membrane protein